MKIDCDYKSEAVCPFCGHAHSDSYEMSEGIQECHSCGKSFYLSVHHSVDYSSSIIECLNDKSLHEWKLVTGYETKTYPGKDHLVYRRCTKCYQYKWLDKSEVLK